MRRFLPLLFLLILLFSGCAAPAEAPEDTGLRIVASSYPAYDFARQIAGERASVTMLTPPGVDPHEYEPTPQNIIDMQKCDLFLYNGGDSDAWVDTMLQGLDNPDIRILRMMDCTALLEEETVDGMESDEEEEAEVEFDEHVWLSPVNVIEIAGAIEQALSEADPDGAAYYRQNLENYSARLNELDARLMEIAANGQRRTIVFADRFPARYFTERYGLSYYAAFPGCSAQTEPSAATVAFLIEKVKAEEIPFVFSVPFSSTTLPQTIQEATGAQVLIFDSFHNVGRDDFGKATYLEAMEHNAQALEQALN